MDIQEFYEIVISIVDVWFRRNIAFYSKFQPDLENQFSTILIWTVRFRCID